MEKIRVLYLLNFAGKAGTEKYVEAIVRTLKDEKIEPFFAYNIEGLLVKRMKDMGVPVFQVAMNSRFDIKAAKKVAELCREKGIEIVHTQFLRENYIALLAKLFNRKIKVVYTNHLILENNAVTRLSNRLLSGMQDKMIAVCGKGREQLIKNGNSPSKIEVIFNALDTQYWGEKEASTLRAELGIPEERFVVFSGLRFAAGKGHEYMINAVKRLSELTEKPFAVVFAGDGELLEGAKAQAKQLGIENRIYFLGFREDMKNLYQAADIAVSHSDSEALSFFILESIASGLPVIATDVGGNEDIISRQSGCGVLVKYGDAEELAQCMKTFMDNEEMRQRFGEEAKKTAREKFDISVMADRTFKLYEEVRK